MESHVLVKNTTNNSNSNSSVKATPRKSRKSRKSIKRKRKVFNSNGNSNGNSNNGIRVYYEDPNINHRLRYALDFRAIYPETPIKSKNNKPKNKKPKKNKPKNSIKRTLNKTPQCHTEKGHYRPYEGRCGDGDETEDIYGRLYDEYGKPICCERLYPLTQIPGVKYKNNRNPNPNLNPNPNSNSKQNIYINGTPGGQFYRAQLHY